MNWNPSWANAIASIESQGSGGYSAVGPTTQKGNRAYGKYQVMDFNIPTWTKKHLGQELTPKQFLQSPEAQDAVFKGEFGSYVSKYGTPQDAASAWFTGQPQSRGSNKSDVLGTTGSGYVNKFNNALGTGATSTGGPQMMQPKQQPPKGLLGSLGIQKMEEGAEGDAGERFYNRKSFGNTLASLAPALGRMGVMGLEVPAQAVANRRFANQKEAAAEAKSIAQRNKSLEFLAQQEGGEDYVRLAQAVGVPTAIKAYLESKKSPKDGKVATAIEEFEYAKANNNLPEGVSSLPEYKKYIARAGRNVPDVTMHPTLNRPLSPIEISVDNEIAKTFGETVTTGLSAANRNAATIKSVLDRLGSTEEGEALTGPSKGMLGSFGRNVFAPTSQAALNDVSAVVQQSLREILGGQFAQKEGEQLIARAYDISAPPPVNAARLRALYTQLESIAANKAALIDYVEKYGTSAGFSGTTVTPSVDVFYNAMDRAVPQVESEQGPLLPGQTYTDQQLEDAMANYFEKSKGGVNQ